MERVADSLMQIRKYSGTFSKHLIAIEKFSKLLSEQMITGQEPDLPALSTVANEQALAAYNTAAVAGMR